jgi:hypothetical protein
MKVNRQDTSRRTTSQSVLSRSFGSPKPKGLCLGVQRRGCDGAAVIRGQCTLLNLWHAWVMSFKTVFAKGVIALLGSSAMFASFAMPADSRTATIPACRSEQLQTFAYGTGIGTGTEYFAISIANTGRTRCRIGSEIQLLHRVGGKLTTLAAEPGTRLDGKRISVLKARQRATAVITTTWAVEDYNNPDCPEGKPHPLDRVVALRLNTGTTTFLKDSLDLERCRRRVSPLTDDEWLTKCELVSPACEPIPTGKHRPQIG